MAPLYRIEAAGTTTQISAAQENLVISVSSRSFFLFGWRIYRFGGRAARPESWGQPCAKSGPGGGQACG
jgi:hypothetical protein